MLDTGVRIGEALSLQWADVHLVPITTARFGLVRIRGGKSKNARRHIPLTERVREMLRARKLHQQVGADQGGWIFTSNRGGPLAVDTLDKLHAQARRAIQANKDFVLHSLRHTMLSRLGEAGADAFTIMRVAGHSTVVVSQRYVHPSEESVERAFERLEALNGRRSQLSPPDLSGAATFSTTLLPAKAASRH